MLRFIDVLEYNQEKGFEDTSALDKHMKYMNLQKMKKNSFSQKILLLLNPI